ncbi:hypothetical protein [Cochleicola gelatinilyticus]|uniref:Uncharacterized protein n=1 Tax=Cochleicola gelatinilyticus TaxID=1763537 RepID=A0A167F3M3_9FLAO|nr:hypothetical protein [Cochleicola gelatinilyticus]OAB76158.1 hypothetical protein ULVI_13965 [Cochleicola gelatinilyticus]
MWRIFSSWNLSFCSILFCFLISSTVVRAQEKIIDGAIINTIEVEGIHIINTTSRYNTITNTDGGFSIRAHENDTLIVSSVNYFPKKEVISKTVFETGKITITLTPLVNELDEVLLGSTLTGNLATDLKNIKTERPINFDDVGIPGYKGTPKERIVPLYVAAFPTQVDIEALYKHFSGYYKKLKIRRKWEQQNIDVANLLNRYGVLFFEEAYGIPNDRLYDFLLFCMETTDVQSYFKSENYSGVLEVFKESALEYTNRLQQIKE